MTDNHLVIIIPCYNEAERLHIKEFILFLEKIEGVKLFFVNDASTDTTQTVLEGLKKKKPEQVELLTNEKNKGKAESIRLAVNQVLKDSWSNKFAYLDADLATSLEECYSYLTYFEDGKQFVFASRILKIGSIVERKFSRFLFGRIIATFISNILDIKVYDTQCGCKLFTKEIAKIAFNEPFLSRWLFDVEIFSRLLKHYGKVKALKLMEEVPVKSWIDQGESKVRLSYFFKLWIDLYKIWKSHRT